MPAMAREARVARASGAARLPAVLAMLTALTLLAACGGGRPSSSGEDEHVTVPALGTVQTLADPKSHQGAVHVSAPAGVVDPVTGPQQLPATVVDAQGTTVTVKDTSRILALDIYGTLSRTVFELGLGDKVVGRDISSGFPEIAKRPLVTVNGHNLNAESILGLNPTVILTDTSLGPWDVILQMRDAGIPVVVVDSGRSLDNVSSLIQQVADALGVHDSGVRLAQRTQSQIDEVKAQVDAVAPRADGDRLRMVFLYARGQSGVYYMMGEGSGADSLIDALDGYDVAAEIGWKGMRPVSDEGLVAARPDLVLMMTKGLESVGGVSGLLKRFPALASTPAGQARRFVDMPDTEILSFGPLTASVLNALAVAVYAPDAL